MRQSEREMQVTSGRGKAGLMAGSAGRVERVGEEGYGVNPAR
jgi:hypothetical protein